MNKLLFALLVSCVLVVGQSQAVMAQDSILLPSVLSDDVQASRATEDNGSVNVTLRQMSRGKVVTMRGETFQLPPNAYIHGQLVSSNCIVNSSRPCAPAPGFKIKHGNSEAVFAGDGNLYLPDAARDGPQFQFIVDKIGQGRVIDMKNPRKPTPQASVKASAVTQNFIYLTDDQDKLDDFNPPGWPGYNAPSAGHFYVYQQNNYCPSCTHLLRLRGYNLSSAMSNELNNAINDWLPYMEPWMQVQRVYSGTPHVSVMEGNCGGASGCFFITGWNANITGKVNSIYTSEFYIDTSEGIWDNNDRRAVLSHELGHALVGLHDRYGGNGNCGGESSIMDAMFLNENNNQISHCANIIKPTVIDANRTEDYWRSTALYIKDIDSFIYQNVFYGSYKDLSFTDVYAEVEYEKSSNQYGGFTVFATGGIVAEVASHHSVDPYAVTSSTSVSSVPYGWYVRACVTPYVGCDNLNNSHPQCNGDRVEGSRVCMNAVRK